MNIPNFINSKVIGDNGFLTPEWQQILMQLFTELQQKVSEEGFILPIQSSSNIGILNNIDSLAAIIYNEDTNKAMLNENGTFKTIQTI